MERYVDHVVIVGAGLAGVSVAEALRAHDYTGRITLLSDEHRLPYDRPPLSKAALLDDPCPPDELLRPEAFYSTHDITLRLGANVARLDPAGSSVELADGELILASAVVLATGATPRAIDLPGANLEGVCTLRNADDAARIRTYLEQSRPVAVVGGGFIGTEVAAASLARGCSTTLIEAEELPMLRALGPEVAALLTNAHRSRGVHVRTGVSVRGFKGDTSVQEVLLDDGTSVRADLVVVGIGIAPNIQLAVKAGLEVGDGVHVDAAGRTSNPAVWAAGDVASLPRANGARTRGEHWQHAKDQAVVVAQGLLGIEAANTTVPWFWSDQYDLNIQLAGHPDPNDASVWRGAIEDLSFSVLHHRDSVLTGITAINRGKDVRPAMELIRRGCALDADLLGDPQTTPKSLLKTVR